MTGFDLYIGIDYSGAETPTSRLSAQQAYAARPGAPEPERWSSPTRSNNRQRVNWTRREIAERLGDEVRSDTRLLAAIDHGFSFPISYFAVGKSTHAGIPWLNWPPDEPGDAVHFWPFDGWTPPLGKAVIAEVYPSVFRNRYPREGRSADEQDAYATARWMADMSARGVLDAYFAPPLTLAEREMAELVPEKWTPRSLLL